MSSVFDERDDYMRNQIFLKREKGDFTPFYVTIAICTIFGAFLIVLNVVFCCSRYREYWLDSNTGNRWVLPLWTKTPDKQLPLDLTELNEEYIPKPQVIDVDYPDYYTYPPSEQADEFLELYPQQHQQRQPYSRESDL